MNKKVLILDAQAVQTLVVARSLHRAGYEVRLLCDDSLTYGYHTRYADYRQTGPHSDDPHYSEFLINHIRTNAIDVVIPMTDSSAECVSRNREALSELCSFVMPPFEVFSRGYDKNSLMHICKDNDFPHPLTLDLSQSADKAESMLYPALIKPNHMTGGRGMTLVSNYKEFLERYPSIRNQYGECHLQEFIPSGGRQLKVQVLMNRGKAHCGSVIWKQRFYPENGGSSCCNITISDDRLVGMCEKLLQITGWEGFADFDLIEDPRDGVVKFMELNPRIPACIKSAVESGTDYPLLIVEQSLGLPLGEVTYTPGHRLRHIGFELLWFAYSRNRFSSRPCWFNFFGRKLSFQDFSWSDPLPFLYGTIGNMRKQFSKQFRASKAGLR